MNVIFYSDVRHFKDKKVKKFVKKISEMLVNGTPIMSVSVIYFHCPAVVEVMLF